MVKRRPAADIESSLPAPVVFRDGIGMRVRLVDPVFGDLIERCYLAAELQQVGELVRERVGRLGNFRHVRFPRLRGVDVDAEIDGSPLFVASDPVEGTRVSAVLDFVEREPLTLDINAALQVARELLPALAVFHDSRNVTHGSLGSERLVLTPQGRVSIVDHALGSALEKLQFPRTRLWREFRIPMPASAGLPKFDTRADVAQVALATFELVLGRRLRLAEFPDGLASLLDEPVERLANGTVRPLSAALQAWFARALPVQTRRPFNTALEAQVALEDAIKKSRAYAPSSAALKSFLQRFEARRAIVSPASPPADEIAPLPVPASRRPPVEAPSEPAPKTRRGSRSSSRTPPPRRLTPEEEEAEEIRALEAELARLALLDARHETSSAEAPEVAAADETPPCDSPASSQTLAFNEDLDELAPGLIELVDVESLAATVEAFERETEPLVDLVSGSPDAEAATAPGVGEVDLAVDVAAALPDEATSDAVTLDPAELVAAEDDEPAWMLVSPTPDTFERRAEPPGVDEVEAPVRDEWTLELPWDAEPEPLALCRVADRLGALVGPTATPLTLAAARVVTGDGRRPRRLPVRRARRPRRPSGLPAAPARKLLPSTALPVDATLAPMPARTFMAGEAFDVRFAAALGDVVARLACGGPLARPHTRAAPLALPDHISRTEPVALVPVAAKAAIAFAAGPRALPVEHVCEATGADEAAPAALSPIADASPTSVAPLSINLLETPADPPTILDASPPRADADPIQAAADDTSLEATAGVDVVDWDSFVAGVDDVGVDLVDVSGTTADEPVQASTNIELLSARGAVDPTGVDQIEGLEGVDPDLLALLAEVEAIEQADTAAPAAEPPPAADYEPRLEVPELLEALAAFERGETLPDVALVGIDVTEPAEVAPPRPQEVSATVVDLREPAPVPVVVSRGDQVAPPAAHMAEAPAPVASVPEVASVPPAVDTRPIEDSPTLEAPEAAAPVTRAPRERRRPRRKPRAAEPVAGSSVEVLREVPTKAPEEDPSSVSSGSSSFAVAPLRPSVPEVVPTVVAERVSWVDRPEPVPPPPPVTVPAPVDARPEAHRVLESVRAEPAPGDTRDLHAVLGVSEPLGLGPGVALPTAVGASMPAVSGAGAEEPAVEVLEPRAGHDFGAAPRRRWWSEVDWKRTAAAIVVLAIIESAAFAAAYWMVRPSELGTLRVATTSPGVDVVIDGQPVGKTPLSVDLRQGRYTIELKSEGQSKTLPVEIAAGVQTSQLVTWTSRQGLGSLGITSNPTGARVLIAGRERGVTPLIIDDLAVGSHELHVESEAGTVRRNVVVRQGERVDVDVPIYSGWLTVFAPVEIRIFEQGRLIGTSLDGRIMMPPGHHEIELVNPKLGIRSTSVVEIRPGQVEAISLEAPNGSLEVDAPAGTEIFVNGQSMGVTPVEVFSLPVGTHDILLRHPMLGQRRQAVSVATGASTRVSLLAPQ